MGNKSPEIYAFIGREGAGKSTHAHELAKHLDRPYISTGDILRDLAANDLGPWGDACRTMFEKSVYLDGDLLIEILVDRLSQPDCQNGFVLDGGFRTTKETLEFKRMLVSSGRDYHLKVFHLRLPGWIGMDRLVTGPDARLRGDDTIENVLKRMSKYEHHLPKRVNIIKAIKDWNIVHINASQSVEQVYEDLLNKLNHHD